MATVRRKSDSRVVEEDGFVFKKLKRPVQVGKGVLILKSKGFHILEQEAAAKNKEADVTAAKLRRETKLRKEVSKLKALRDRLRTNEQLQETFLCEGDLQMGEGTRDAEEGNAACLSNGDKQSSETRQLVDKLEESAAAVSRTLELQVDAIESMLEGIEDMVDQAERLSAQVATDFHEEVFSGLPAHTPRTLIRRLAAVKPIAG